MGVPPGDFLYVTAYQMQRIPRFNYGGDERILPCNLFKIGLTPD
jgi:hypothetical protein